MVLRSLAAKTLKAWPTTSIYVVPGIALVPPVTRPPPLASESDRLPRSAVGVADRLCDQVALQCDALRKASYRCQSILRSLVISTHVLTDFLVFGILLFSLNFRN